MLRATVRGSAMLAGATFVSQAIGFAILAIVARRVGPENLGAYGVAQALTMYFALPADFGLSLLAIREMAQQPERARQITGEVLAIGLPIAAVAYALLVIAGAALTSSDLAARLLPLFGLAIVLSRLNLEWALRAARRLDLVAAVVLASQLCYGVAAPLLVTSGSSGIYWYTGLNTAQSGLSAALSGFFAWRLVGRPRMRVDVRTLWQRARRSAPLGISLAMIFIYYSLDVLMLGWLRGTEEVGLYTTAYKIPLALITLAGVWVSGFYPHAAVLAKRDPAALRNDVGTVTTYAIVLAGALVVGGALTAHDLMTTLFGPAFAAAGAPFAVLVAAAAMVLVSVNFGNVLLAAGQERAYLVGVTAGAAANAAINLVVIRPFGPVGAAAATLASELVVMAWMVHRFRRTLGVPSLDTGRLLRAVGAVAIMAGGMIVAGGLNPVVEVGVGIAVFALAAPVCRVITVRDVRLLLRRQRGAPA